MDQHLILWPLLAQILLVLLMYLRLAAVKTREIEAGNVDLAKAAIDQNEWPVSVRLINNNLRNQFETPILFYILCVVIWALRGVDMAVMVVTCIYVLFRYSHAIIHTTSNIVKYRFTMFMLSMVTLTVLFGLTVRTLITL